MMNSPQNQQNNQPNAKIINDHEIQRVIRVTGLVQGIGFRPWVWRMANESKLHGWVCNDARGVVIVVQGAPHPIEQFTQRLSAEMPPLAQVRALQWTDTAPTPELPNTFSVVASKSGISTTMIGADSAICADCLAELFNPLDRRWRYALINCSHCGPRYTVTRGLPYDRAQTSLAEFPLCPACAAEYHNPADRRFYAEPIACPACGPQLTLESFTSAEPSDADPITETLRLLRAGAIVALKGLGGFHLACDARNYAAVRHLRYRKQREEKPLALLVANPASILIWAELNDAERLLLESSARPIVLLRKRPHADILFPEIAAGLAWLGVMLPYTPLQWLLFHEAARRPLGTHWLTMPQELVLVMTSANPGGEPLVTDNNEARTRLVGIADALLMHNRPIVVRCDDSVTYVDDGPRFIRRARGYAPLPLRLARSGPAVLALGGLFKNTICVTRGDEAFVAQHIGGLDNPATSAMLLEVTHHLLSLLAVKPTRIAHDLHPDFFSTRQAQRWAAAWGIPTLAVQHHHAHLAAVLAEHGVSGPALGLAMDGMGLGSDQSAWGGELLYVDGAAFRRVGHLTPLPLPGGDRAAWEPWRMAAAVLHRLGRGAEIAPRFADQTAARHLAAMLTAGRFCQPTTSLGRWFDAAAGLLGVRARCAYEGQAALLLEGLAERYGAVEAQRGGYELRADGSLDLLPLLAQLADEADAARGAALFHATLAEALAAWTISAAQRFRLNTIVLGGGCFLNRLLTRALIRRLAAHKITVLTARQIPPNDGGLSLGQAWIALQQNNAISFSDHP